MAAQFISNTGANANVLSGKATAIFIDVNDQ